jgi:SAM-dependent methyltransferase
MFNDSTPTDPLKKLRLQRALDFINGLGPKQRVLEIGFLGGAFCAELQRLGHEPHGIEVVPELVENARRAFPGVDFIVGNCQEKLPYPDGMFDAVWAGEVIEHIGHTDVFVNEINRVLKVGGYVILTTPMHNRVKNLYVVLFNFERHFNPEFPHYRFYSKKSLTAVLERRGFKVAHVSYIGRFAPIANVFFLAAQKIGNKAVMSEHRY